ncbi:class I SAM-dependent methyltransferase [Haloglomus halophilum]|uniref:class I SAM-dependent methyltransferase n=1 Tax=Haloglomus halophilum TaxID=2962672 RepID=UPI0020C99199|nr:methyltransferase domain-containing protein [Haloglomus halophilum]
MSGRGVAEFYGDNAALYDRIATLPPVGRWRARAVAALDLAPGDTVVEMGCGTGANLPYLRRAVGPGGRVVGVDLTGPLLARARDRVAREGWTNVHVVQGDATSPPVTAPDALLATFVVGLLDDPATAVEDWCALVAGGPGDGTGGRVALVDATASEHPAGRFLNPAFRAFVAAGAPSSSAEDVARALVPGSDLDGPLSERVRASRRTLTARSRARRYETMGLGFVGVLSGQV